MVITITSAEHLNQQLILAGDKLVVICFLILENTLSDTMLDTLSAAAHKYADSIVVLVVNVTEQGELVKQYRAIQIPWFTFMKTGYTIEAFHSVSTRKVGDTIRGYIGVKESSAQLLRSYVADSDDLDRRLEEAKNKLVVLAFVIPDDEAGQRLNTSLDNIEDRDDDVVVFKVDVDMCKDVTNKYKVQGVPTLVFIKNQVKLEEYTGHDPEKLTLTIMKYIQPLKRTDEWHNSSVDLQSNVEESVGTSMADPTKKIVYQGD